VQLKDLVKPISEQTDEELMERLRAVRNRRNFIKPAAEARKKRTAKKGGQARINKAEALLELLSEEELRQLLQEK
jgi:hypothetical protein